MESTFVNPVGFFSFNFDLKYYRAYKILKEPCFFFNEGDYEQGAKEMTVCVGWLWRFLRGKQCWGDKRSREKEKNVPAWNCSNNLILVILSSICRWQWFPTACFGRKGEWWWWNPKIKNHCVKQMWGREVIRYGKVYALLYFIRVMRKCAMPFRIYQFLYQRILMTNSTILCFEIYLLLKPFVGFLDFLYAH